MPAHTTVPPLRTALSCRHERADRRINDCGIERFGRRFLRTASPLRPKAQGESLGLRIVRVRESKDPSILKAGDLCDDMRRRAEPIEAKRLGLARELERAPPDEARAKQGRDLRIRACFAERESIARIGNTFGGIAAIARVAGKEGSIAQ